VLVGLLPAVLAPPPRLVSTPRDHALRDVGVAA
jgi:hypothetical protein